MAEIQSGPWKGARIRTARKSGQCQHFDDRDRCPKMINAGDRYFEGYMDADRGGGFAKERYCMDHGPQPVRGDISSENLSAVLLASYRALLAIRDRRFPAPADVEQLCAEIPSLIAALNMRPGWTPGAELDLTTAGQGRS